MPVHAVDGQFDKNEPDHAVHEGDTKPDTKSQQEEEQMVDRGEVSATSGDSESDGSTEYEDGNCQMAFHPAQAPISKHHVLSSLEGNIMCLLLVLTCVHTYSWVR